jgi:hypothetical protein
MDSKLVSFNQISIFNKSKKYIYKHFLLRDDCWALVLFCSFVSLTKRNVNVNKFYTTQEEPFKIRAFVFYNPLDVVNAKKVTKV